MESPSSSSPSSEPPAEAAAAATTPRDDAQASPGAQTTSPAAAAPDGDARWARPAQRHFLEATCDAPPLRFGRGSAGGSSSRALFGVRAQEQAVFERLRRSAAQGESTSLVLCGHRGCGKHATLARALARLDADAGLPRYDVAELSGLVHAEAATGDATARVRLYHGRARDCSAQTEPGRHPSHARLHTRRGGSGDIGDGAPLLCPVAALSWWPRLGVGMAMASAG